MSGRGHHIFIVAFLVVWFAALWAHGVEVHEEALFRQLADSIPVSVYDDVPLPSQESIDAAMAMYGIRLPHGALHPEFVEGLRDRGLTIRGTWVKESAVFIGPAAFESWSLLGSTLAHELEVHCKQNFFLIASLDFLGLDGAAAAERQAYFYELENSGRFDLKPADTELIAATVAYYYPTADRPMGLGLGTFAARSFKRWIEGQILPR